MSDAKGEFVVHRSGAPQDGGEGFNWTLPILALIVASGLGYYMTRGGEDDPQSATPRPAVTTIAEVPSSQLILACSLPASAGSSSLAACTSSMMCARGR